MGIIPIFLRTFVILCHIIYNKVYDFRRYTRYLSKNLAMSELLLIFAPVIT